MFNFERLEAMRFNTITLFVGGIVLFISCGNTPKNSPNGNFFDGYSSDEANNSEFTFLNIYLILDVIGKHKL